MKKRIAHSQTVLYSSDRRKRRQCFRQQHVQRGAVAANQLVVHLVTKNRSIRVTTIPSYWVTDQGRCMRLLCCLVRDEKSWFFPRPAIRVDCLTFQHTNDSKLKNLPFDIENCNVAKISRQQRLLAPALVTDSDYQGGIRFAKVGSEGGGYVFEILSIPGVGIDSRDQQIPCIIKATGGVASLMEDTATYLGDNWPASNVELGDSTSGQYVAACRKINASASQCYLGKVLSDSVTKLQSDTDYKNASLRYLLGIIEHVPSSECARPVTDGGYRNERRQSTTRRTSMAAHITNVCNSVNEEGSHYPIGGPRTFCHALCSVIEQCGSVRTTV